MAGEAEIRGGCEVKGGRGQQEEEGREAAVPPRCLPAAGEAEDSQKEILTNLLNYTI